MNRLHRLQVHRIEASVVTARLANEVYQKIEHNDGAEYAMQPIDPENTKNTYRQADWVRDQLDDRLSESSDHDFEGPDTCAGAPRASEPRSSMSEGGGSLFAAY